PPPNNGSGERTKQNKQVTSSATTRRIRVPARRSDEQRSTQASQMYVLGPATTCFAVRVQNEHEGGSCGGLSMLAPVATRRKCSNRRLQWTFRDSLARRRPSSASRRAAFLSPRSSAAAQSVASLTSGGSVTFDSEWPVEH